MKVKNMVDHHVNMYNTEGYCGISWVEPTIDPEFGIPSHLVELLKTVEGITGVKISVNEKTWNIQDNSKVKRTK